ncbi:hypothetical protein DXG01_012417 [Tephrocybe rancida]|nr:hypothetical protein DXG01_012417 [Tephrocybe rancida]
MATATNAPGGPCSAPGCPCPRFEAELPSTQYLFNSPCASCNQQWIAHSPEVPPAIPTPAQPNTVTTMPWQPPLPPPQGTANDRRTEHARQTFSTNSAFSANSSSRGHRQRGYPSAFQAAPVSHGSSSRHSGGTGTATRTYQVALLPYGPCNTTEADALDRELGRIGGLYEPRIFKNKIASFTRHLEKHKLLFEISITGTLREEIWKEFNNSVVRHCQENHLQMNPHKFPLRLHITTYDDLQFWVLQPGNQPRGEHGQLLKDAKLVAYEFTLAKLDSISSLMKNPLSSTPLLWLAGKARVDGPIYPGNTVMHPCFVDRALIGVRLIDMEEEPEDDGRRRTADCIKNHCASNEPEDDYQLLNDPMPSTPPPTTPFLRSDSSTFTDSVFSGLSTANSTRRANPFSRQDSPTPSTSADLLPPLLSHTRAPVPAPSPILVLDPAPVPPLTALPRISIASVSASAPLPIADTMTHKDWMRHLDGTIQRTTTRSLSILAPTEASGGKAFLDCLISHYGGTPASTPVPVDGDPVPVASEVLTWNFYVLPGGVRVIRIGQGIGEGVDKAILTKAIELCFSTSEADWREIGCAHHKTWAVTTNRLNSSREATLKTLGTLSAAYLCWFKTLPPVISPWMILLAALGLEDLQDLPKIFNIAVLQAQDPELAESLLAWPTDFNTRPNFAPTSTCSQLISTHLQGVNLREVRQAFDNQDREEWLDLTNRLYSEALFSTSIELKTCRALHAFREGFNLCLTTQVKLGDTFKGVEQAQKLFAEMSTSILRTPQQVINAVRIIDPATDTTSEAFGGGVPAQGVNAEHQNLFSIFFARYLRGFGYPVRLDGMQPEDDLYTDTIREAPTATSALFRCQRILKLATGGKTIPVTPSGADWELTVSLGFPQHTYLTIDQVRFIRRLPARAGTNSDTDLTLEDTTALLSFRSCFSEMQIIATPALLASLRQPIPDSDSAFTPFDLLIHPCIVMGDGFTQI